MQTLFKILYGLFIVVVLGLGLLLIASMVPVPGSYDLKIVQSGSMEPAITTGSVVVVRPAETYQVGDVITFGEDNRREVPTTHRIVSDRVENGVFLYTTKGDANENADPQEVREGEIIGKVLFDIPFLGFILDFARQPVGFILLIGIPAAIVVFDEAAKIWGEVKTVRKKRQKQKNPSTLSSNNEETKEGKEKEDSDLQNTDEEKRT